MHARIGHFRISGATSSEKAGFDGNILTPKTTGEN